MERLRLMATDDTVDSAVRQKCKVLFVQWANAYSKTPGLERIATLYKEFPKTQRPAAARQKVLQDNTAADPDADTSESPFAEPRQRSKSNAKAPVQAPPSRPVGLTSSSSGISSKLFKEKKHSTTAGKPFNLSKEKENMTNALAKSSIASTNLLNGLQLINREHERVSDNEEVQRRVEACKALRRKILYYINNVESDKWIGSLVNANDELVKALTAYEIMDRSIDDDSDSDAWESLGEQRPKSSKGVSSDTHEQLAGLTISDEAPPPKPPRPASIPMPPPPPVPSSSQAKLDDDAEDDDDPFGDSNAVQTPYIERSGMTWREV